MCDYSLSHEKSEKMSTKYFEPRAPQSFNPALRVLVYFMCEEHCSQNCKIRVHYIFDFAGSALEAQH